MSFGNSWSSCHTIDKENLRDNMSNLELVLNMLAEVTTTELSKEKNPHGFRESADIAKLGGSIVGDTRKQIEKKIGKPVATAKRHELSATKEDTE